MLDKFDISYDDVVLTSTYVTYDKLPILYVTHELDDENSPVWQFHCGNGDYSSEKLLLVRFENILELDSSVTNLSNLSLGYEAKRKNINEAWIYSQIS